MTAEPTNTSIKQCGAVPFADVTLTGNICPESILKLINKKLKLFVLSYGGYPAEIDKIFKIAKINFFLLKTVHMH